ncbi:hypothetical protein S83_059739, partial [Arachis hypogaea]
HSVDSEKPLDPESIFSENDEDLSPKFRERRGVLYLFRSSSHSSIPSPSSRSSLVFILTVPNHISFNDLIRWCGPHLHHHHRLLFIRLGIGEIKKMVFPGANESIFPFYLSFFPLPMAKQKENESINVCVDDKVTNYLNGRDVQQVLHAKLIGVCKWDVCSKNLNSNHLEEEHLEEKFICIKIYILDEYNRLLTSQLETQRQ